MIRSFKARLAACAVSYCALVAGASAQTFHSNTIGADIKAIFRDYVVDGVPSSGAYNPKKSDIRSFGVALDSAVRVITPQNYGAACDGVTNDTTALQAWAAAFTSGSVGYIPTGACLTTAQLTFGIGNGVTLHGSGPGSEIRYVGGSTSVNVLSFGTTNGSCSISEWDIGGFIVTSTTAMTGGAATIINDGCHIALHHFVVANNAGGAFGNWFNGLYVNGGNQVYVDNYTLTGSGSPLILVGDTVANSSTQLTDARFGKGIVIGGVFGVHIAGNVGGAVLDGMDMLSNQTQLRISQDGTPIANKQIVIGPSSFIDATNGGAGIGINIVDTGSNNSILMLKNAWVTSAANYCIQIAATAQWVLDWHGGQMLNCGVDGIRNNSTSLIAHIDGVTIGNVAGYAGFSGYGVNCVVADANVMMSNIKFVSSIGTSEFSPNCTPVSFSLAGSNAIYSKVPNANYGAPLTAWQTDFSNQTVFSLANGANVVLPAGSGTISVNEQTGGAVGSYVCGGGACALLASSQPTWVASTTTPAAGKMSIAWNGVNYAIYNNSGASVFIAASLSRLRNIN